MADTHVNHPATRSVREYLGARPAREVRTVVSEKLPRNREAVTRDYSDFVIVQALGSLVALVRKAKRYSVLKTLKGWLKAAHAEIGAVIVPAVLVIVIGGMITFMEMGVKHREFLDVITPSNIAPILWIFGIFLVPIILYLTLFWVVVIFEALLILRDALISAFLRIRK